MYNVHVGESAIPELLDLLDCEGVECEVGGGDSDEGGGEREESEEEGSGDASEAGCTWVIPVKEGEMIPCVFMYAVCTHATA